MLETLGDLLSLDSKLSALENFGAKIHYGIMMMILFSYDITKLLVRTE